MIRFNLNGRWIEESEIGPEWTILRYLRTKLAQTDVKEGCAGGDCGACTVMLGEPTPEGVRYKTLNACIALAAQLHNRYLITPQGLVQGDELHPAQQAMIDHHGSQCGFCTPGFVMSMATLYQNTQLAGGEQPNEDEIHQALSGNLCRCTGYRPIIDAAKSMADYPVKDMNVTLGVQTFDPAASTHHDDTEALLSDGERQLFMPTTEEQLKAILAKYPNATLWAGGTDLGLEISQRFTQFDTIVVLNRIASLQTVSEDTTSMSLGAALSYSDAERALASSFPSFAHLVERIGSRQVRNMGTLGGNIANASPIGDTPPVFFALQAELEIDGAHGRRKVAINDFFTGYKQTTLQAGEYLRAVIVPKLAANETLVLHKVSKRYDDDISAVMFAAKTQVDNDHVTDITIACGGMAATPKRAAAVEAALKNQPLTIESFKQATTKVEQDYQPITDVRATSAYRVQVVKNLLQKACLETQSSQNTINGGAV